MSIELFEHNQKAYEAAVAMLAETSKASIIHHTGTGKSFIGFKYCEDNPDKMVCWLSPSRYIFKMQIQNLKNTGAEVPQNIKFFTYKKLMLMSEEEIGEIGATALICDEYHRLGAPMWNGSFRVLMDKFPNIPMLGLSATNIRYLDNQRSIVTERFEIIDEVADCRKLFKELDETLTVSWDIMYENARKYYIATGGFIFLRECRREYCTLIKWIDTQRNIRAGKALSELSEKQIKKLDEIGIRWEGINDISWKRNFDAYKKYVENGGDLLVPQDFTTENGVEIGKWLSMLRIYKKSGIRSNYFTEERKKLLKKWVLYGIMRILCGKEIIRQRYPFLKGRATLRCLTDILKTELNYIIGSPIFAKNTAAIINKESVQLRKYRCSDLMNWECAGSHRLI